MIGLNITNEELRRIRIKQLDAYKDTKKVIDDIKNLYENLSMLVTENGKAFILPSMVGCCQMNTELLDSIGMTLKSIELCLEFGCLSDVYTLVRKFRDDSFLYLYFLEVINNFRIDNEAASKHEKNFYNWTKNKLKHLNISDIFKYLRKNETISIAIEKHDLEEMWESIRKKLNDFVHTNGRRYALLNFVQIIDFSKEFDDIKNILIYISVTFITILILIDTTLISSTDYISCLDFGMTPPDGCQYEIAPFIQSFFDNYISNFNNELSQFIKKASFMNFS